MQGNNYTIIITTKNYPLAAWENFCELKRSINQLDFNDKSNIAANETLYFKHLQFGQFSVFVAPCLVECPYDEMFTPDGVRRAYLEYIITTVCNKVENYVDYAYLFAHDKDFGKSGNAIVTEKDIPVGTEPVTSLSKLIKCNHVYRFQHQNRLSEIMLKISSYTDDNKRPCFGEEDCKELVDMVDKEYRLRCFFQDINNDVLNRYPVSKTEYL